MKWEYIEEISKASDRYGNELINLMEKYNAVNLQEITEKQAREYFNNLKERR